MSKLFLSTLGTVNGFQIVNDGSELQLLSGKMVAIQFTKNDLALYITVPTGGGTPASGFFYKSLFPFTAGITIQKEIFSHSGGLNGLPH